MDELHRRRDGECALGGSAHGFGGRQGQGRPQPLATGKEEMAHGGVQRFGGFARGGDRRVEGALDEPGALLEVRGQVH